MPTNILRQVSRAGKQTAAAFTSSGASQTTTNSILAAERTTELLKKAADRLPRFHLKYGRTTISRDWEITSSWNSWIKSGTNDYKLTTDPGAKDALLYVPGAGLSDLEQQGLADKTQRFTQSNGTTSPLSEFSYNTGDQDEFTRLELAAKIFVAPPVKFKGLEELVTAHIVRNQLPFQYGFSYLKITGDTVMVPITIELDNRSMSFEEKDGVHLGTLNLYARISTIGGRMVQIFEDTIQRDFPDSLFQQELTHNPFMAKRFR